MALTKSEAGKLGYKKSIDGQRKRFQRLRREWEIRDIRCPECNTPISYEKRSLKFCNSSCAARFNNKQRPRQTRICPQCKEITTNPKFCSVPCSAVYRVEQRLRKSKREGLIDIPGDDSKTLRRYLKLVKPYVCSICGLTPEWEGKSLVLRADHINGNASDNQLDNLRWVCPNCDSQLPTFGMRNKGKGRAKRRMYRKQNPQHG